jgi:hypothetical protein
MADGLELRSGDLVLVRRATTFFAVVTNCTARQVAIEPCDQAVPDRLIRPGEILQIYRPVGRPADPPSRRLRPSPRQLRLDE